MWSTMSGTLFVFVTCRLYECAKVEIVVANPFDENVEFQVEIVNINKKKTDKVLELMRLSKTKKRKGKNKLVQDLEQKSAEVVSLVPMFYSKQKTLKIKKYGVEKFCLFYQPITFEPHLAQIGTPTTT
jgi:hypothetical protein